ncbi:MAG: DUF3301 domain-containing protein [Pseudomonadota bacterium]|jgi:hypothetical protein
MTELLVLIGLAAVGWFWLDSMAVREIAVRTARNACREEGVQFLDETVALDRLGVRRNERGRLLPRRAYRFEFSDTGDNRLRGMVVVVGRRVEMLDLEKRFTETHLPD